MATEVIYARVPAELKNAVDAHAAHLGITLTAAVAELISHGLESAANEQSIANLQASLSEARLTLSERDRNLAEERSRAATLEERERNLRAVVQQLDTVTVGRCPQPGCVASLTATDLVVRRACPNGHQLGGVLEQVAKAPGLDPAEVLAAVAALGLLVAILAATRK